MRHIMSPSCVFMEYIPLRMAMRRTEFTPRQSGLMHLIDRTLGPRGPDDARIGSLPEQMNNAHSYIDVCPKLQNRSLRQIVVLERTQYLLSLLNRTTLDHSDIQCYLPCSKAVRLHYKAKRLGIRFLHLDTGSYVKMR